ncbi:MAG: (2Fe-2S)-binding protein [Granulosicoccus sp.]
MTTVRVSIYIDDALFQCEAGSTVASVLLTNDVYTFSTHPVDQSPRGAFCMMGACQACRILVDEHWQQACQCAVSDGMKIRLPDELNMPLSGAPHSDTASINAGQHSND